MASKARKKFRAAERHDARQERKKRAAAAKPLGYQGGALLADVSELKQDATLITQAVTEIWPVKPSQAAVIVDRLMGIVEKKTVTVPCGESVFESEAVADANATKAAALMKSLVDANKRHSGNQKPAQTTINVGVNVDNRIDERRSRTLAIAQRFGTGRVLLEDSTGDG